MQTILIVKPYIWLNNKQSFAMSRFRLSFLVLIGIIVFAACESDFDPTSPAGSTPYVVCVLNAKDSAQYVRVQRSFIANENAYNFSSEPDSLYYKIEDIQVFLARFDTLDGAMMENPIELYPTTEIPKDSGGFSSNGHYLFKTTEPIHASFEYELSIFFPNEDKRISSRIMPLGNWNIFHAFNEEERKTRYSWYHVEDIDYFTDLTPNQHKQLTRFLFVEMTPTDTTNKYIEYYHDYESFGTLDDGFEEQEFFGDNFLLRFIQREIPELPNVRRIAKGVDFMIQIPDSNLVVARTVDDPDSKFMYTPDFNNIKNGGVGLFASQYKLTIFGKALRRDELDSISMGKFTKHLNFADSRGNFHDGR